MSRRILWVWGGGVTFFAATLLMFPHKEASFAAFFTYSLQYLLLILSIYIAKNEPSQKNKYIFLNFAAFFSLSIPSHLFVFVGTVFFPNESFARLYVNQYVCYGLYYFLLASAITYLTIDVLFRDYKTYQKYLLTLILVGAFFGFYYGGFLADAKYTHHSADVQDWKMLSTTYEDFVKTNGYAPSAKELASLTPLHSWDQGQPVGTLYPEARLARVEALYRYLPDDYMVLVYKPIWQYAMNMSVVCIGFVLLFFGYLYMKDPPQGAYIEKIMFLLLVFCSLEILHSWSAIKSVELGAASAIWAIGNYVSTVVLLFIAGTFAMRLRFITSPKGEFYEQELASSPTGVTRWRDALDNIVVEKFFNRKLILGRLFVSPTRK